MPSGVGDKKQCNTFIGAIDRCIEVLSPIWIRLSINSLAGWMRKAVKFVVPVEKDIEEYCVAVWVFGAAKVFNIFFWILNVSGW